MTTELSGAVRSAYRRLFPTDIRRLMEDSSWGFASTIVSLGLQLAETVILARFLGADVFGMFVLITAYPEVVLQLMDSRVREAMTRYLMVFLVREQKAQAVALVKLLWMLDAATGLSAFLLVWLTATLAVRWWNLDAATQPLIVIYALGLFLGSLDTASGSVLRVFDRFDLAFRLGSAGSLARFALVAAAVLWGESLNAVVWARTLAELIVTTLQGAACYFLLKQHLWAYRHSPLSALRGRIREIAGFAFHTNLAATTKAVASKLDVLILGLFWSPGVVGVYKIASRFAGLLLLVSDPISPAILPNFSRRFAASGSGGLVQLAVHVARVVGPLAALSGVVYAVVAPRILSLTVGESFQPAVEPLRIMLAGMTSLAAFFWVRPFILSVGKARVLMGISVVAATLQLVLLLLLVPKLGPTGGATALSTGYVAFIGLELLYLHREGLLQAGKRQPVSDAPARIP